MKKVLEPSTNTHEIEAKHVEVEDLGKGTLKLDVEGEGIITHGEHGTIKTESKHIYKVVQKELNPITKKLQNAFD